MKKNFKFFGIVIFIMTLGFSMAACEILPDDEPETLSGKYTCDDGSGWYLYFYENGSVYLYTPDEGKINGTYAVNGSTVVLSISGTGDTLTIVNPNKLRDSYGDNWIKN